MFDPQQPKERMTEARPDNNEYYDVAYMAGKMGVTIEAVKDAIRIVGNNRDYLEAFLKR